MGAIVAKLWRRKKSTREVLEKIRDQISDIEEFNQSTQVWHKKLIGYLLAYFSVLYLIGALVAYLKFFNKPGWRDFTSQIQLLAPFIVAPFILIFLKRLLTWWYHRKIKKNEITSENLKKQKTKILDEIMETETYKVAKELLDEFASDQEKRALNVTKSPAPAALSKNKTFMETPKGSTPNPSGMEIRRRLTTPALAQQQQQPPQSSSRPQNAQTSSSSAALGASFIQEKPNNEKSSPAKQQRPGPNASRMLQNATSIVGRSAPGPPLPRPVLPRDRGYMDRVVEYLVGDGPNNRYALICRQCQSHNGMALKEEFEYIAYRCCYCHYWNPARKQRPTAPKLEASSTLRTQASTESSSSDEESTTESRPSKGQSHSSNPDSNDAKNEEELTEKSSKMSKNEEKSSETVDDNLTENEEVPMDVEPTEKPSDKKEN